MNDIKVFNYQDNEVRTIEKDGETYWILKDVCDALGLSNARMVADRLDDDEVRKFDLRGLSGESNAVNESGLYNVILRSDKPEAKAFKRWVTHEVLPSIRKTGAYATPLSPLEQLQLQVKIMQDLERKQREQQKAIEATNQRIDTMGDILTMNFNAWREESKAMVVRIAQVWGGNEYIREVYAEIYKQIDTRFAVNLKRRLANMKAAAAFEGKSKTYVNGLTKIDVIADDKKMVEAYITVIREMAVKYGVDKVA